MKVALITAGVILAIWVWYEIKTAPVLEDEPKEMDAPPDGKENNKK